MRNNSVRAKKHLGQHFLIDEGISHRISNSLTGHGAYKQILEIGPGTGALTEFLIQLDYELCLLDIDQESIDFLHVKYPSLIGSINKSDFINDPLPDKLNPPYAVIGNFPYNISSQIMFKILEIRDDVPEIVGMFQKEVAERLVSPPGSKKYGILSVLLQTWYDGEYLFTVNEDVFDPPPKVKSGVIRFKRNNRKSLEVSEKFYKSVIKMGFNQRRKTLRNSLKSLIIEHEIDNSLEIFSKRPEQLSVEEFIQLTSLFEK
jgi:16S rRNA (adenine1518-N6/adenine1519-N6)-dimethyltransferase